MKAKKMQYGGAEHFDPNGHKKMKTGGTVKKMKTGGMVNANANLQAGKKAGSNGVKSGINPKAIAQSSPKGRVGGGNKSVPRPSKG